MANMLEWLIKMHCQAEQLGWPPREENTSPGRSQAGSRSDAGSLAGFKRRT